MALWFFHRTAPGQLRRLTLPAMQRFLVGELRVDADDDGYVRCIGVSVTMRNRKPAALERLWFSKIRVGRDGIIDPDHRPSLVRIAQQAARSPEAAPANLIDADHHFAQRRLTNLVEWRPEQADVDALRSLIAERTGKQML